MTRLDKVFPYAIISVLGVFLFTGCTTTLDGNWDGEMDCGSWGDVDLEIDLDKKTNQVYDGDGEITGMYLDNDPATLTFDLDITKLNLSGAQELDLELDNCEFDVVGYESIDVDCDEPEKVEWDGENVITGEIEDFLGMDGVDCDFEIER